MFCNVYNELGDGFLESVGEKALVLALTMAGVQAAHRVPIPVWFRGALVGEFCAGVLVEGKVRSSW